MPIGAVKTVLEKNKINIGLTGSKISPFSERSGILGPWEIIESRNNKTKTLAEIDMEERLALSVARKLDKCCAELHSRRCPVEHECRNQYINIEPNLKNIRQIYAIFDRLKAKRNQLINYDVT